MIELKGITKSYANLVVLRDVSVFIQESEIFGIIGKSGAGKSTLLRCMNRLESPDEGEVLIDNEPLTTLKPAELRKTRHKIGMIFQQFNLLQSKTVYDNIALPMRIQGIDEALIEAKINELLPLVELSDKVHAYPAQLSGGQKQRVAIARALSTSPKILLCDEATSALDPETTESILALLKKINALYGITMVLITHEMEVIKRICHRVAIMEAGQILETADLADLFSPKNHAQKTSLAKNLLYAQLSPKLPPCIHARLSDTPTNKPILRLFFEGAEASAPFISQVSRELHLDINILLANIDRIDAMACGVLVVELNADNAVLNTFLTRCKEAHLTAEILGYVTNTVV
jgi:D-methionine transport system ATP-binding protein